MMLNQNTDGRQSSLPVPADEPCAVGTCTHDGVYTVSGHKVCWKHFDAYLRDEIDLEEYFQLKEQKMLEALMFLSFCCVESDESDDDDFLD